MAKLLAAHEAWYDLERDYEYAGHTFAGYGEFHSHGERYVLVKRAKLWEVDAHDYLFIDLVDHLDEPALQRAAQFMETQGLKKVDPKPNHMKSSLTLVIIANDVDDGGKRACRKTKFSKSFMFGIRGWADLRLAVVDLSKPEVITNAAGKEIKATLEANIASESDDAGANKEE